MERISLSPATRRLAPGSFVQLSSGFTHYQLGGDPGAPCVVLVCGFSVPFIVFDPTFEALTNADLRVLRYDLFGRGWSDRPAELYDVNLFCRQLGELLEALGIGSASLVGLSMGGAIAASYAAGQPGVVRRLVLIDPAGAQGVPISRWVRIFRFPVVGDILFGALLGAGLIWAAGSGHLEHSAVAALKKAVSDQLRIRGSRSALLSTARNGMLGDFLDVYGRLHKLHIPVLIVWGREDRIVPIAQSARLRAALPEAEFRPIDGCGHMPHFERPGHVNALLAEFLK